MKLAFAGLRHSHIFGLYDRAMEMEGYEVVGAWEADEAARAAAQEKMNVPFFETYEEILANPEVDAVAVGDYYGIRGQLIIKALDAGKHVIADKPICTSLQELEIIKTKATEKKLKVACMLDLRYDGAVRGAKKIVEEGKLGKINAMAFTGQHPLSYGTRPMWYFEEGKHGGTINDIAIHGIDVLRYITGLDYVKTTAARTWNAYAKEVPFFNDCAQLMAEYEGGAGVMADVSYAAQTATAWSMPSYWRFNIWGENGAVEFRYGENKLIFADKNSTAVETVECEPVAENWLHDFAKDYDEAAVLDVIASSKAALRIQKDADEANK